MRKHRTFTMSDEAFDKLKKMAEKNNHSMSRMIELLVIKAEKKDVKNG